MSTELPPDWICGKCAASFTPTERQVRICSHECPDCRRARERAYRAKRKSQGNPVKSYAEDLAVRRARYAMKSADPAYRQRRNASQRERFADPMRKQKVKTRAITLRAIASGKLVRMACEVCLSLSTEAHHDDYNKPLDVRWLCRTHHRQHHSALRRGIELGKSS